MNVWKRKVIVEFVPRPLFFLFTPWRRLFKNYEILLTLGKVKKYIWDIILYMVTTDLFLYVFFPFCLPWRECIVWKVEKECENKNAKKFYTFITLIIKSYMIVKVGKRINIFKKLSSSLSLVPSSFSSLWRRLFKKHVLEMLNIHYLNLFLIHMSLSKVVLYIWKYFLWSWYLFISRANIGPNPDLKS